MLFNIFVLRNQDFTAITHVCISSTTYTQREFSSLSVCLYPFTFDYEAISKLTLLSFISF